LSLVGCASNLLSLFCLSKIKQKQLTTNADRILFGLIVSDITTCFIIMPYRFVFHLYKPKIIAMCLIRRIFTYYFMVSTFWSSSMMISFVAINRYVKVRIFLYTCGLDEYLRMYFSPWDRFFSKTSGQLNEVKKGL